MSFTAVTGMRVFAVRSTNPDTNTIEFFGTEQVAEICQVSPATVRGWRYRHKLNVVKLPGGSVRVNQAEVDRLVSGAAAPSKESV